MGTCDIFLLMVFCEHFQYAPGSHFVVSQQNLLDCGTVKLPNGDRLISEQYAFDLFNNPI